MKCRCQVFLQQFVRIYKQLVVGKLRTYELNISVDWDCALFSFPLNLDGSKIHVMGACSFLFFE